MRVVLAKHYTSELGVSIYSVVVSVTCSFVVSITVVCGDDGHLAARF